MQLVVSAEQMRALDSRAIQEFKIPGAQLMESAGRALCDASVPFLLQSNRVVVVCGTGNNGGDGFVAARLLRNKGYEVAVFVLGDPQQIRGDASTVFETLVALEDTPPIFLNATTLPSLRESLSKTDLVIDAIFGTGLNKIISGVAFSAIELINQCQRPIIAADLPSGIHANTGAVLGIAVHATKTVTFGLPKMGLYLYPGREHTGLIQVADIGIPEAAKNGFDWQTYAFSASDGPALLPRRKRTSHKGDFGHVVVRAGSTKCPGAAILVAEGALRVGAGLVSWATNISLAPLAHRMPAEVMLRTFENENLKPVDYLDGATSVVLGPGLGIHQAARNEIAELLSKSSIPVCFDADALTLIADSPELLKQAEVPVVLTPHPKEMARLAKSNVAAVQNDRPAIAKKFARDYGAVVILKGAATVVASPQGDMALIAAGNPGLAKGGTGDVLAGMVGGFLANGLPAYEASILAALCHGVGADRAVNLHGEAGLRARDLIEALGEVFVMWDR